MDRLQKFLAAAGVCSRRHAETLIITGRVTVNGDIITLLGTRVDPECDIVTVDGQLITLPTMLNTIMLHKPAGFLTTVSDPRQRDTVMTLVPPIDGLHPIGRLDKDTTGLLLLTNDGALTFALTHPRHHVNKTYRAWVNGLPNDKHLQQLRNGIELGDGITAPANVTVITCETSRTLLELTIHEGRNRQIRRMLLAIGHPVLTLARIRIGLLSLDDLPEASWRNLSDIEIQDLYAAAGSPHT
jgi:23S rRNA pseudouridine2605 synthase